MAYPKRGGKNNSMWGKTHKNKDQFRKYPGHPAIDYEDFIETPNRPKRYMMTCLICKKLKGYRRLDSILLPCFPCAMAKNVKYTPIQRRIRESVKSRLNSRLRRKLLGKTAGIHFKDMPFTLESLMGHLESKFRDGMSWENYGGNSGWQIDHIKPESSFSYISVTDIQFVECWSLSNLQPLWKIENLKKGAKSA